MCLTKYKSPTNRVEPWCVGCWAGKTQSSSYFSVVVHTFLSLKENLITRVLIAMNDHIKFQILFPKSYFSLNCQLYLHFLEKSKHYNLGNKGFSRKLFRLWQLSLSNLLMRRYEASLRIQQQSPQGFHERVYKNHTCLGVFNTLIWLILDCWIHNYSSYYGP